MRFAACNLNGQTNRGSLCNINNNKRFTGDCLLHSRFLFPCGISSQLPSIGTFPCGDNDDRPGG